ncbi:helix-turn-helix domain-containing protein [Streptomyces sp. NBC_00184]|uniref:helix-turn-helix domain-containing protein n=1 Tax=Streptomyces sp. NBC_00184 TaxID=2975673 RepID=UPI002E285C01|nr:helix-turn-helix domain-containing protein [Streptomyces sp. NBC_00184]
MATSQAIAGPYVPPSGVEHVNVRHTERFTVVGNHLSQHPELSLAARGLAVHIQSLPPGAKVGIKVLAARLPADSEHRIAEALRELEEYGYLKRTRVRSPKGKVYTRTVSYNHPDPAALDKAQTQTQTRTQTQTTKPRPRPAPAPAPKPTTATPPPPPAQPEPEPAPLPRVPAPTAKKPPRPPLPQPVSPRPQLLQAAALLLVGLQNQDAELVLTEEQIDFLTPGVAAWFERGASPAAVRKALTEDLPRPVRFPAQLMRHRLTVSLPSGRSLPAAYLPVPMQNCDGCDRAFRAPEPGHCDECSGATHSDPLNSCG